jgi:diguanylate cyclase (GGDEF)-like protein/hemerythrin-like metal-binding protein
MTAFLTAQLDYVYFVYGLALVLLGAICLSMSREGAIGAPWGLLAAFGFTHGLVDWVHIVSLATATSPAMELAQSVLIAASFSVLLEFARRTQLAIRGSTPGPWIYLVLAAGVAALVLVGGMASLRSALRLLVAGPAIFWTAALLGLASLRAARPQAGFAPAQALGWAAVFLAAFGVVSAIVVPATPFLPPGWPTAVAFLEVTGIPVPLFRAAFIGGVALAIWAYAVSLDGRARLRRKRARSFWLMAAAMVAVLGAGWMFTERLGKLHETDAARDAEVASAQILDHIVMEMEAADDDARILAGLLTRFHAADASRRDSAVDVVAAGRADRVAYFIDPTGVTQAASNRAEPDSFVGKNYAMRPYFQEAINGYPGRFVGIGLTSRLPGFFASQPVRDDSGGITGVAVVKKTLTAESFGPKGAENSFVVAPDGRVLLAGSLRYEGRPLWTQAVPGGARENRAPILDRPVTGTEWTVLDGERHIAVRRPIPGSDWSVVTLKAEAVQVVNRFLGIVITFLLSVVIIFFFLVVQRQYGTESKLADRHREAEGRAREMARRADSDALTGILNRFGFNEAFSREFSRARRYRQPLSLLLVDLDHFKNVNDRYGHPAGDKVLAGAARLLESHIRESDTVARWGGEEFAIVAPMTDASGAAQLAEKIRGLMEVTHVGPVGAVTASFGVTEMRPDDTVEAMLHRVDAALYRAKESGRNQVRCAESWIDPIRAATPEKPGTESALADGRQLYNDTGFGPIDAEHKALSEGLEAFIGKVNGGGIDQVRPALAALIAGVGAHFGHEEELMDDFSYPLRDRHKEAHALFVGDAQRFQAELEKGGVTPNFRRWAVGRLPEWFRYHILAHDMGLGHFLTKAGAPGWRGAPRAVASSRRAEGVEP